MKNGKPESTPRHAGHQDSSWDFLRHPLIVAIAGTIIAGVVLFYVQTAAARKKELQSQQILVAQDVIEFNAKAQSALRTTTEFARGFKFHHLSNQNPRTHIEEDRVQDAMNDVLERQDKLESKLLLYFRRNEIFYAFADLKSTYADAENLALTRAKEGKDPEEELKPIRLRMTMQTVGVLNAMGPDLGLPHKIKIIKDWPHQ